ncbi:MAG: PAS domain S-box protein [Candidatus Odinarchaeota archaeon]
MTNPLMKHSKIGRILSENVEDLIFILNEKYNCEYNNFQQYPISKKINDYVHPQDFERVSRLLKDIFRTGYGSEEIQLKYDGKPFKCFEIKGKSFIDSEDRKKKVLLICRDISKYKKLELDLKRSQASFYEIIDSLPEIQFWRLIQSRKGINMVQQTSEMIQLVFDNIPQLICWKDINLVYMGCNKNFAFLNKLTEPMSIIGRRDENLIWHKGKFHTFIDKEQEVIRHDKPQYHAIESINFSKNHQTWFEINRIPLHDSKNNVVGILITYEDITDRKLTEQKLRESEKNYRHLFENSSYSIILIDRKGKIIDCNQATEKIFSRKIEDLKNKNFLEIGLKPEKIIPIFKQRYQSVLKGIIPKPIEIQISRSRDGALIWISIDDSIVEIDGENIFQISIQDITEKKIAEQELKKSQEELTVLNRELEQKVFEKTKDLIESEQQYRTTINSLNDPLHVVNKDLEIILSNNAFISWLAELDIEKQIVNKKVFEAFPFLHDKVYKEYEDVFNNGKILLTEESFILNGKEIFTETRKIPIFSEGSVNQIITIIRDISEKIKAEQELKESEEKFRNIAENSLMGIMILQDGLLKYFNDRVTETTGYSVEEIESWVPNEFAKTLHPEDREFVMEQAQKKQAGDPDVINQYQYRIITKDGVIKWLEIFAKTINYEGHPADLAMTVDITDKIKVEQELKESEEKFRNITEQSLMGIFIIQDGLLKYFNKKVVETSGYSAEEIKNWSPNKFTIITHPDDLEFTWEQAIKKQTGDPNVIHQYIYRIIRKDGEVRWIESFSKTINYKGHPADLAMTIDITDKILAEKQLKESEENFRDMIMNLEVAYYKVKWKGNLLYHNPAFNKIVGYDIHENLIGQPPPFFWENSIDREEYLEKSLKDGYIRNHILHLIRKDKEKIVVQVNARLIKDENNNPIAIEGTFSDVTEKFRLEQELLESEKKLRQQNIELKKLDKIKNDFITMAAHELKTPLISISGYTDYILMKHREYLKTEITRDLLIVQRNVKRLEILMDQLLDVMKIDENVLKLKKELVNVSKIINNCLDELSYLINEKNLEIILNIEHEILLNADPMRISTVFTNLISNAIKYTSDYGWIEISATKKDYEYFFKVKDNGVGLTQDEIGRLFKKFERIKPTISTKNINIKDSGTGLGLYITKGIITTHGGRIWAESKGLNKGTTFIFSIPI